MQVIDLSQQLYTGMPVFPGDPEVVIEKVLEIENSGWEMRRLQISSHDGTHVNVPSHIRHNAQSLNDLPVDYFFGTAKVYKTGMQMNSSFGVIFSDENITKEIAEYIKQTKPRFVGLSEKFDFDLDIEKDLLEHGVISYEKLTNTEKLPAEFNFFGVPLNIKNGEGSPVRAFAVVE